MLDQVSVLTIVLIPVCRSEINSKSDQGVDQISTRVNQILVLDQVSVLRILLISLCSRSEVKSKSDLCVKSGISVRNYKNQVFVSV